MDISCIFFGIAFMAAGLLFAFGKLHPHLSAWKNMSDDEKRKINSRALAANVGGMIMLSGVLFLLRGLVSGFSGKWFVGAMIAWLILAGFDVRHISKSDRYRNQ